MERLTFDGNFCDIACCTEQRGGEHCPDRYCSQRRVWERLKAYEDTGLEPEDIKSLEAEWCVCKQLVEEYRAIGTIDHLRELVQAEKDGLLVMLPCKVGDTVYYNLCGWTHEAGVRTFFCGHPSHKSEPVNIVMIRTTECDLDMRKFGKTVFLTREEAEAALEAQKGGGGA
ncbi:hypothetical protein [uncultured Dysosmobacter sp.]|uniref:hypothetical protein n=1 Tax=uncultured Dysosmobacter sp. TaxID=2591384 RepID=UPI00262D432B|nr:hypothetical protein [uncultured Dysosmobacter sp.]